MQIGINLGPILSAQISLDSLNRSFTRTIDSVTRTSESMGRLTDSVNHSAGTVANSADSVTRSAGAVATSADSVTRSAGAVATSAETVNRSTGTVASSADSVTRSAGTVVRATDGVNHSAGVVANSADSVTRSAGAVTNSAESVTRSAGTVASSGESVTRSAGTVVRATEGVNHSAGVVANSAESVTRSAGVVANSAATVNNSVGLTARLTEGVTSSVATVASITEVVNHSAGAVTGSAGRVAGSAGRVAGSAASVADSAVVVTHSAGIAARLTESVTASAGTVVSSAESVTRSAGTTATSAETVNRSAGTTATSAESINRSAGTVANSAETVTRSAGTTATSAETINRSAGVVANSAETVNRSVGTVTSSAETINRSMGVVANSAETVNRSSGTVASSATSVNRSAGTVASSAETVNRSSGTVASSAETLNRSAGTVASSAASISNSAGTISRTTTETVKIAGEGVTTLDKVFTAFVAGYAAFQAGSAFLDIANQMSAASDRLKVVTNDMQKFVNTSNLAYMIAQQSAAGYVDVVKLTGKLLPALEQIGVSSSNTMGFIRTFSQILALSGAETTGATGAIMQFSQALNSGVLRGEEFNSIAENTPKILHYVAKELGVSQGALKNLSSEGRITSTVLFKAIAHNTDAVAEEFAKFTDRSDMAAARLKNAFFDVIDKINRSGAISKTVSNIINYFTLSLEQLSGRAKASGHEFTILASAVKAVINADVVEFLTHNFLTVAEAVTTMINRIKGIANIFLFGDDEFEIVKFDKEETLKKIRAFFASFRKEMSKGLDGVSEDFKMGNAYAMDLGVNEKYFDNLDKILRMEKHIKLMGVGTLDVTPEAALQLELQAEKLKVALKYGKEYAETWSKIEAVTKAYQFKLTNEAIEAKMMQQVKALDLLKVGEEAYNLTIKNIMFSYGQMERNNIDRAKNQAELDKAAATTALNARNAKIVDSLEEAQQATKKLESMQKQLTLTKLLSVAEIELAKEKAKTLGMTEEQIAIVAKGAEDKKALERLTTVAKENDGLKEKNDLLKEEVRLRKAGYSAKEAEIRAKLINSPNYDVETAIENTKLEEQLKTQNTKNTRTKTVDTGKELRDFLKENARIAQAIVDLSGSKTKTDADKAMSKSKERLDTSIGFIKKAVDERFNLENILEIVKIVKDEEFALTLLEEAIQSYNSANDSVIAAKTEQERDTAKEQLYQYKDLDAIGKKIAFEKQIDEQLELLDNAESKEKLIAVKSQHLLQMKKRKQLEFTKELINQANENRSLAKLGSKSNERMSTILVDLNAETGYSENKRRTNRVDNKRIIDEYDLSQKLRRKELTAESYKTLLATVRESYKFDLGVLKTEGLKALKDINEQFAKELKNLNEQDLSPKSKGSSAISVYAKEQTEAIDELAITNALDIKEISYAKAQLQKVLDAKIKANDPFEQLRIANYSTTADNFSSVLVNSLETGDLSNVFDDLANGFAGNLTNLLKDSLHDFSVEYGEIASSMALGYQGANAIANLTGFKQNAVGNAIGAIGGMFGPQGAAIGALIAGATGKKTSTKQFISVNEAGEVAKVTKTRTSSVYGLSNSSSTDYEQSAYFRKEFDDLIIKLRQLGDATVKLTASWGNTAETIKGDMVKHFLGGKLGNAGYQQVIDDTYAKVDRNRINNFKNPDLYVFDSVEEEWNYAFNQLTIAEQSAYNFAEGISKTIAVWEVAAKESNKSVDEFVTEVYSLNKEITRNIELFGLTKAKDILDQKLTHLRQDMQAFNLGILTLAELSANLTATTDPAQIQKLQAYYQLLNEEQTLIKDYNTEVLNERIGLETELANLNHDVAYIRRKELDALNDTNKALKQSIYTLTDYKDGLAKLADAMSKQISELEDKSDKSHTSADNAYNRANTLIEERLTKIVDETNKQLTEATNASQKSYNTSLTSQNDLINNISSFTSSLESLIKKQTTDDRSFERIRSDINTALDYFKTTVTVTSSADAFKIIQDKLDLLNDNKDELYATKEEYIASQRNIFNTASQQLATQKTQKTAAQQTLETLQAQLDTLGESSNQDLAYYKEHLDKLGSFKTEFETLIAQQKQIEDLMKVFDTNASATVNLTTAITQLATAVAEWKTTQSKLTELKALEESKVVKDTSVVSVNQTPVATVKSGISVVDIDALDAATKSGGVDTTPPPKLTETTFTLDYTKPTGNPPANSPVIDVSTTKANETKVNTNTPEISFSAITAKINNLFSNKPSVSFGRFLKPIGRFKNGIESIPYDDYPAFLHKGEKVMTKQEVTISDNISEKLDQLIALMEQIGVKQLSENIKGNRLLRDLLETSREA